ncbi:MAG: hypothetical protein Kow00122_03170 [Thermoleophilia bacterium]
MVDNMAREADVIVEGMLAEVIEGRWNTEDGRAWGQIPDEAVAEPVIYTTYLVKPTSILKGKTNPGSLVAFHVKGGVDSAIVSPEERKALDEQGISAPLRLDIGDEIVVFGYEFWPYGGSVLPPGYTTDVSGIFIRGRGDAREYARLLPSPDGTPEEARVTPERIRQAVATLPAE